jgi:electron transfer flavoprotein beta subunit
VVIAPEGRAVRTDGPVSFRMNRYDEYALEEAVLIREAFGDVSIDALSVGPYRYSSTLKKCLEKGANNAVHILLEEEGYVPPGRTASLIAGYADRSGYDLIFTGVMAEDDMQCQTGPLVAALLDIPCAVAVMEERLDRDSAMISVKCEMEGGMSERMMLPLPCLLTVQSGINRPRYPSLSNVFRAKEQPIVTIPAGNIEPAVPSERVIRLTCPERYTSGAIIEGSTEDKARRLISILHERALL